MLNVSCERCRFVGDLLGAAPTKAAAQNSSVPSLLVALVGTGTFGLALASGSWETGAATAVERSGRLAEVEVRDQATVELQVSFVLLLFKTI